MRTKVPVQHPWASCVHIFSQNSFIAFPVTKEWTAKVSAFCDIGVVVLDSWNIGKIDLCSKKLQTFK